MEFKFFTAEEARELEKASPGDSGDISKISNKIREKARMGSYVLQLPHNLYSDEALEEFQKAGFDIKKTPTSGILISWENAVDKENESKYVFSAYDLKVETDSALFNILRDIEVSIRYWIEEVPGAGYWNSHTKLSKAARDIIQDHGFKITQSGEGRGACDIIHWPVE